MADWRNKFFNGQRPKKEMMLILFLSGILIFVILLPVDKGNKNSTSYFGKSDASNNEIKKSVQPSEAEMLLNYKKSMEAELEALLAGVPGVGEADVLIYMNASWEHEVEKDESVSADSKTEETVYTFNEYGQEIPFVRSVMCPKIEGVAAVVKGNINDEERVRLVRLIMTLYGLEANKAEVVAAAY